MQLDGGGPCVVDYKIVLHSPTQVGKERQSFDDHLLWNVVMFLFQLTISSEVICVQQMAICWR